MLIGALLAHCASGTDVLPKPEPPFQGKIDPSRDKSSPAWPQRTSASKGAPNVPL